ncbi:tripartite tricarboxylate transporter substrate binding protein [Aquabacterium sp. J223]|uniref:tripartite tricarboxylate transporter substrate binding protein n=1 Tax=Aquabacterium sp. J223 TaxID=2898431 RepID=UPI0021AD594F|nr:tripartite tricarboxylate transporter substrate binding protein [Aquabacterium sp. J223]UUX97389.1 tripartite tricarboxylate transporter substrate binding protein [Aquabacterium sp. J223]
MNRLQRMFAAAAAWLLGAASLAALPQAALAQAAAYPSKPITFVAPIPPGGSTDVLARDVARRLQERLGQPVIVENKPGGAGSIGSAPVARGPADGHTILLVNTAHVINPHVYSKLPFDAMKDFTPVVWMTSLPLGLYVNSSFPARTLAEFIATAKAQPGALSFTSSGNGGATHLFGEMFMLQSGTKMVHVPYRGSAPAIADVVGGQVPVAMADAPLAAPHVKSGALRALAVTSKTRVAAMPDVPTFGEAGLPGLENSVWIGVLAAAGTPPDIVRRLNREIVAIVREPAMTQRLVELGFEIVGSTPEEFGAQMRQDYERFGAIVRNAKIKID